jgi:hypothetical protein
MNFDDFTDYLAECVNEISSREDFSKTRKLCHGVVMGCFSKWPIVLQKLVLRLSVFPNSFNALGNYHFQHLLIPI